MAVEIRQLAHFEKQEECINIIRANRKPKKIAQSIDDLRQLTMNSFLLDTLPAADRAYFVQTTQNTMVHIINTTEWPELQEQAFDSLRTLTYAQDILHALSEEERLRYVQASQHAFINMLHCEEPRLDATKEGAMESLRNITYDADILSMIPDEAAMDYVRLTQNTLITILESSDDAEMRQNALRSLRLITIDNDISNAFTEAEHAEFQKKNFDVIFAFADEDSYQNIRNDLMKMTGYIPYIKEVHLYQIGFLSVNDHRGKELTTQLSVMDAFLSDKDDVTKKRYVDLLETHRDDIAVKYAANFSDLGNLDLAAAAQEKEDYDRLQNLIHKLQPKNV